MKRRHVLAATGLGVTSTTAGCLQRFDVQRGGDGDERPVLQSASSADGATPIPSGETVERDPGDGTLGDGGRRHPHTVFVTNPTKTTRTVALSIDQDASTVLDEPFTIEPDGATKVSITTLAAYTVAATVTGTGETATTTIERNQFDCNATSVTMELQADGTISSSTLSTMMACGNVVTERVASGDEFEHTIGTIEDSDAMQGRHTIRASNPTEHTRTVRVLLEEGAITRFDGLFTIEPDASADVRFDRKGSESIDARVLDTGASATVDLDEANHGCNDATTTIECTDAGTLETSTISTDLYCPSDAA